MLFRIEVSKMGYEMGYDEDEEDKEIKQLREENEELKKDLRDVRERWRDLKEKTGNMVF